MACADISIHLADEDLALRLQLEEIEAQRACQTGKWVEGNTPDPLLAFNEFEAEIKQALSLSQDVKLAHSIAKAVDSDAVAINEATAEERQSVQDREFALSLNEGRGLPTQGLIEGPAPSCSTQSWIDWAYVPRATEAATPSTDSNTTIAGPSFPYTLRQREGLEQLPQLKVDCSVCGESVHPHVTVRLACNDIYCKPCLKDFFMRVAYDEGLFPPKCHSQPIELSVIEADLSAEDLAVYRSAELEFGSTCRVYCADPACAKFIPIAHRTLDTALCAVCGVESCMHCKALAHHGSACPEDKEGQSLIQFANEQGWKACHGCSRIVSRDEGCDHMTCKCGTEFCYRCGTQWKRCGCSDWVPELLDRRAQEVVDREATFPLAPAARQRRVEAMALQLQENHECNHRGKFTKLDVGRRGRVCEMCGTRHRKYILSCKTCHMLACEDCRRHRT